MKEYYNILLTTDYSEAVMNAERYAIQFAINTNSNIKILHIYDEPFVSLLMESNVAGKLLKYKKAELKKLKNHRNKLLRSLHTNKHELNCECIVKEDRKSVV